jgi:hypothetical protein
VDVTSYQVYETFTGTTRIADRLEQQQLRARRRPARRS